MILLIDIGNTHTHIGLGDDVRVVAWDHFPTGDWRRSGGLDGIEALARGAEIEGISLASVVPEVTSLAKERLTGRWDVPYLELTHETVAGVGIDYPVPESIGPDRLANAVAAIQQFGAPVVVIDFGTAVTFDVINRAGNYIGGVIAPGLAAMTDYLHEKTALLPKIELKFPGRRAIGRDTEGAMRSGAYHGYQGLVREILIEIRRELREAGEIEERHELALVCTGSYAGMITKGERIHEEISIEPHLTLEGLRLSWSLRKGSRL